MDDLGNDSNAGNNKAILATGGYDHTIKLWQAHTGVCYWTGQHADSVSFCISCEILRIICIILSPHIQ